MKHHCIIMAALAWLPLGFRADAAQILVSGNIGTDTTWVNTNEYILTTAIFVTNGATLTIQPGTVVRGYRDGTLQIGTNPPAPGTLIISRGSKLIAKGTPSQPIVMTTTNDDFYLGPNPLTMLGTSPWNVANNNRARQWGGLILLGRTYVAYEDVPGPTGTRFVQIEGLQPYGSISEYGGNDDNDNSGELEYISIRYGGYVLGANNEVNGLTMGAVGRNTKIRQIEVAYNVDDGFEWFGGTVDGKYLLAWNCTDDQFDWDEGYRGRLQFIMAIQGSITIGPPSPEVSDRGFECDGANVDNRAMPHSCPTIYNATIIGLGRHAANLRNSLCHMRDASAGRIYNSMFLDFGGAAGLIQGSLTETNPSSALFTLSNYYNSAFYTHSVEPGAKMLEFKNNLWWNFNSNFFVGAARGSTNQMTPYVEAAYRGEPHYAYPAFTDTTLSNIYLGYSGPYPFGDATNLPIMALIRSAHTNLGSGVSNYIGGRTYYPVEYVDPRPKTNYLHAGRLPPSDGFFTPVQMIGAFGSRNWAYWTLTARLGVLDAGTNHVDYSAFEDNLLVSGINHTVPPFAPIAFVSFPTAAGETYTVERAATPFGPWTPIGTIVGTGSQVTYSDMTPLPTEGYYRLVTALTP
ncbi:MAG: hypothetical protein NZ740_01120 [Kiritimatiellae bacterium]|nr:hypothetical protein [Kiritimatiellia bacterium]MDW8457691.1 hypothetical protein [Verrucomicrobiota bacterium]